MENFEVEASVYFVNCEQPSWKEELEGAGLDPLKVAVLEEYSEFVLADQIGCEQVSNWTFKTTWHCFAEVAASPDYSA